MRATFIAGLLVGASCTPTLAETQDLATKVCIVTQADQLPKIPSLVIVASASAVVSNKQASERLFDEAITSKGLFEKLFDAFGPFPDAKTKAEGDAIARKGDLVGAQHKLAESLASKLAKSMAVDLTATVAGVTLVYTGLCSWNPDGQMITLSPRPVR